EGDAEDSVVLPELLLQLTGQTGLPAAPIAEQADGGRQQIRGLDDLIDRCGEMGNTEEVKFGFVIGPHGFSVPQSVMAYVHITYAAVQLRSIISLEEPTKRIFAATRRQVLIPLPSVDGRAPNAESLSQLLLAETEFEAPGANALPECSRLHVDDRRRRPPAPARQSKYRRSKPSGLSVWPRSIALSGAPIG